MKIYTKTGDQGYTSLLGGERVPKNHPRLMVIGTIDELNAYIGWVRDDLTASSQLEKIRPSLLEIQNFLFNVGSILAAENPNLISVSLPNQKIIHELEKLIDEMDEHLPVLRNFILPGGHSIISKCHVARAICRRAERELFTLSIDNAVPVEIISYINRLSDFLFVLARFVASKLKVEEIKWKSK